MGSVIVGQANVSPIVLAWRPEVSNDLWRRTFAGRDEPRSESRVPETVIVERATELGIIRSLLGGMAQQGEQPEDRAKPGRRSLGVPWQTGYASRMLVQASDADPELHAATIKGGDLLNSDGEVDAAHRVLVAAINSSLSRSDHDIPAIVEALHTLSVVCYFGSRAELWVPFHRTLDLLGDVVPPVLRLIARTCPDPVAALVANLDEIDRQINRLLAGDPDPGQTVLIAMAAQVVDRLADCRDALQRVFLGGNVRIASDWVVRAGLLLAVDAVDAGQWTEAEMLADQCIGLCETSRQQLWAWSGRYVLALVAAGRGQWNDCRAATNEILEWATPRGVLRLIQDARLPAIRTRQRAAATTHPSALAEAGAARLSPRLALQAASAEALVAPDELAVELFQAALHIPGIERWPFDVARVQLAFGERLRRQQATRASREQLAAALDTFTRLGARPWAQRADAELRATGQTRRRLDGRGPATLTPQELGIAELAATGLTNKQIGARLYLSPRTVSAHLYRVFPKLGITSRAALRDALRAVPAP